VHDFGDSQQRHQYHNFDNSFHHDNFFSIHSFDKFYYYYHDHNFDNIDHIDKHHFVLQRGNPQAWVLGSGSQHNATVLSFFILQHDVSDTPIPFFCGSNDFRH